MLEHTKTPTPFPKATNFMLQIPFNQCPSIFRNENIFFEKALFSALFQQKPLYFFCVYTALYTDCLKY
jgi:hypothetical protein